MDCKYLIKYIFSFTLPIAIGIVIFSGNITYSQNILDDNGYNKFYYENGKVSSEGNLKDGKPEGIWKSYFEDGKLKSVGNRVNHQLDSIWTFYDVDGNLKNEITYKSGKKNGTQTNYYSEGGKLTEEMYVDNTRNGQSFKYDKAGKLILEKTFENGLEQGKAKEFAPEDGRIITLITYSKGYIRNRLSINRKDKFGFKQGLWREFYETGITKQEGIYRDDKMHGVFRWFNEDGQLDKMEVYRNDELVLEDPRNNVTLEIERDYHEGGYVKSSVNLIDGIKQGVYREYDTRGNITTSKIYTKGTITGEGKLTEED